MTSFLILPILKFLCILFLFCLYLFCLSFAPQSSLAQDSSCFFLVSLLRGEVGFLRGSLRGGLEGVVMRGGPEGRP